LYEQRHRLGQCFKYRDKCVPGHQYTAKRLHIIEGNEDEDEEFWDAKIRNNNESITKNHKIEEFDLSLNTFVDSYAYNTIRITRSCQRKELIILIDSESIYSFIDEQVIKEVKASILAMFVFRKVISRKSLSKLSCLCLSFEKLVNKKHFLVKEKFGLVSRKVFSWKIWMENTFRKL